MRSSNWYLGSGAAELAALEDRAVRAWAATVTGTRLLWVGPDVPEDAALQAARVPERLVVVPEPPRRPVGAARVTVAWAEQLPLASSEYSAVVLAHALDFSPDPHGALREAARVLELGGRLLLLGFNPWSLLGARRLVSRRNRRPWSGQFLSPLRLIDWLTLLGLDIQSIEYLQYLPWDRTGRALLRRPRALPIGRIAPFGSVYAIRTIRRTPARIVIRPRSAWRAPARAPARVALWSSEQHRDR